MNPHLDCNLLETTCAHLIKTEWELATTKANLLEKQNSGKF